MLYHLCVASLGAFLELHVHCHTLFTTKWDVDMSYMQVVQCGQDEAFAKRLGWKFDSMLCILCAGTQHITGRCSPALHSRYRK